LPADDPGCQAQHEPANQLIALSRHGYSVLFRSRS
jgi:hypothetical protein